MTLSGSSLLIPSLYPNLDGQQDAFKAGRISVGAERAEEM